MSSRRVVTAALAALTCGLPVVLTRSAAQDPGGHGAEIQRRLARWQSDPQLSPFAVAPAAAPSTLPAVSAPAPLDPNRPRTRIAIHFGVNETDPASYGGTNPLAGPENDANNLSALARTLGFESTVYLTRRATSANLFAALRAAAARLQANDILVVTYSGHGSTVTDQNGDESPNTNDSTWCLHDRMVIDDELGAAWTQFAAGVKVYVIADSCHSGTSTRTLSRALNPTSQLESPNQRAFANPGAGGVQVRTLRPNEQRAAEARQVPAFGTLWRAAPGHGVSESRTQASVLLLAACQDHELAGEIGGRGLFTTALIRLADNGRFQGTYRDLITRATDLINDPSQHPRLFQTGAQTLNIERDTPFTH